MPDLKLDNAIKVCVLFDVINSPWGGGNQFLRTLTSELERLGLRVTNRPAPDTQVILINGFNYGANKHLRFKQVAQMKWRGKMTNLGRVIPGWVYALDGRKGPPLIHRVDGVPELVRGHKSMADKVQPAVNRLSDHTIFQTEYCRISFAEHSNIVPGSWRIVHNAVDPQVFFPNLNGAWDSKDPLRLVGVSWSSNPRKGFATLAEASLLPGVEVTFVGNWCPDIPPENVKLTGTLGSEDLAEILRSSHVMLHAAWEEPCSNAIVEALACGLPIIYRDSGGNRELAEDYGVALTEDLSETLDNIRNKYVDLRHKVLLNRDKFLIGRAADEYLSLFQYAIANHQSI